MACKCESCGKFRKPQDIIGMGEVDYERGINDNWTECVYCCSEVDKERHLKTRKFRDYLNEKLKVPEYKAAFDKAMELEQQYIEEK